VLRIKEDQGGSMRWLIVASIVLTVPDVVLAQGLGDAARKEKERRKANAEAGVDARSVDGEVLAAGTGTGKGTFSTTGVATTNGEERRPASGGKPAGTTSSSGRASGPSSMEQLQSKIAMWRARYRPVKSSADALEREVAELEAKESRILVIVTDTTTPRDPNIRTDAERTVERLPRARKELAAARQELITIEEGARRDGVSASQL
jgi:hypothetical protein